MINDEALFELIIGVLHKEMCRAERLSCMKTAKILTPLIIQHYTTHPAPTSNTEAI